MIYQIDFSCGHREGVQIYGKGDKRQWIADQKKLGICPDCEKKAWEENRQKENLEAAKKAKELELPELEGTERQIAWAETLRKKYVDYFSEKQEDAELLSFLLSTKTTAKWYIDNRYELISDIRKTIEKEMEENTPEKKAEKELFKEIEKELTVFPENPIDKEPVRIVIKDDYVRLYFRKDDDFIKFVKSENYKWDGVWQREIDWLAGNIVDRAKEIGNTLLNTGYGITTETKEILDGAISGNFEKECTRWVFNRKDTDLLAIWWRDKDDALYSRARKISGAKWSSPSVTVKKEHYEEVLDFAEMNDFYVADSAYKLIEQYKNSLKFVKPEKVEKEILEENKIDKILDSSRDVLDDLKDED